MTRRRLVQLAMVESEWGSVLTTSRGLAGPEVERRRSKSAIRFRLALPFAPGCVPVDILYAAQKELEPRSRDSE